MHWCVRQAAGGPSVATGRSSHSLLQTRRTPGAAARPGWWLPAARQDGRVPTAIKAMRPPHARDAAAFTFALLLLTTVAKTSALATVACNNAPARDVVFIGLSLSISPSLHLSISPSLHLFVEVTCHCYCYNLKDRRIAFDLKFENSVPSFPSANHAADTLELWIYALDAHRQAARPCSTPCRARPQ